MKKKKSYMDKKNILEEGIISYALSNGLKGFSNVYSELNPDLIIVLGDRFEILSAVIPAFIAKIPIAHIHGGEKTEGSLDDSIRHAITKFSAIHFVAAEEYKNRVIQLGENPQKVFNVGGLGIDSISKLNFLTRNEINKKLGIKFRNKNLLITYHPETVNEKLSLLGIRELLKSLSSMDETTFIFTLGNADAGNKLINKKIIEFVKNTENAYIFDSLGQLNYISVLNECDGVLGNSSSGLLEAPYLKKATVNIGERQQGRLKADSVLDCKPNSELISSSINKIYSKEFQIILDSVQSPYGKPGASRKIFDIILSLNIKSLIKKTFYDLNFDF